MTLIQRILQRIIALQTAHPRWTVCIALFISVLSVVYTVRHLEFLTSQKALISPENRLVRLSEKIDPFDDLDRFAVVIENRSTERSLAFLKALVPLLQNDRRHYQEVFYRVDPEQFRQWSLLYLDPKELSELGTDLKEHQDLIAELGRNPGLNTFFSAVNHEMASKMVGELFTGFLEEDTSVSGDNPLNLDFLITVLKDMHLWLDGGHDFISPWRAVFSGDEEGGGGEDGYFWTGHKRFLLVFVTPEKQDGFAKAEDSLKNLRATIARVKNDFPDIEVGVTGQEALNADEMSAALGDMSLATGLSLAGLTLLLVFFWRGIRRPLMEMAELVIALSWTFGLTTLVVGHLNILSVTFAPLLLGLGIDYGIHWFARYQEEESRRADKKETVRVTMLLMGPGILMAGLTAAFSFFPLVLTGFRGLEELGIITFMGMLMTTVTTICVLPALAVIFDKPGKCRSISLNGTRSLFQLDRRRVLAILLPGIIILGFSFWGATKVKFDLNMLNLQSRNAEAVIWERKIIEGSETSSMYGAVLADSLEEVRTKSAALKALSTVSEVRSIESLLPENQGSKIEFLRTLNPLITGLGGFDKKGGKIDPGELERILGRIRFKMLDSSAVQWGADKPLASQMAEVRELIGQLLVRFRTLPGAQLTTSLGSFQKALMTDLNSKFDLLRQNMTTRPMQINDLPKTLRERFVGENNLYLIRVFPAQNIWEPSLLGKFVADLRSVDPDAIGDPVTLYIFTRAFRDACLKAAVYAVIFIFVLLLVTFRNLIDSLFAMVPLVVGTIWTFGLMRIFGINFNLANSLFLPLVVGAGVEYGIIIVQRWRQGGAESRDCSIPFSTAKGIILAGLTTTVGFGSLTISGHQGIHSLGLLAMLGSLSILAAAVFFLPALMQFFVNFQEDKRLSSSSPISNRQERVPADGDGMRVGPEQRESSCEKK
jgi:hopanoid biosynthesis associated RND transporter like protein HpnN